MHLALKIRQFYRLVMRQSVPAWVRTLAVAPLLVSACTSAGASAPSAHGPATPSPTAQPVPAPAGPSPSRPDAITYSADELAAGQANCPALEEVTPGPVSTVILNIDVPLPRCPVVRLDQRLAVDNPQGVPAAITLGQVRLVIPAHRVGYVDMRRAVSVPGAYFMQVAGRGRQGGDNVGVIVHNPSATRFDGRGHRLS